MWVYALMIATVGTVCRIFWIGRVEGIHNVPRTGKVIIAPNHQSMLDFTFLATVIRRRLYFLIASKFYKNVIVRFALEQMEHIRVDLDADGKKRLYADAKNILDDGKALVVFPEGWMTFDGKIQRGYLGVARMALASEADIIPTVIESYHIYPRHHRRPKFLNARCRIKFLAPIRFENIKGKAPEHIVHELLMPEIAKELGHEYPSEVQR